MLDNLWFPELDYLGLAVKLLSSILVLAAGYLLRRLLRRAINGYIKEEAARYNLRKLSGYAVAALSLLFLFFIWIGRVGNLTVAIGLLGAGLALALQEVIGGFAGWLVIIIRRPFRVGDRIEMGDIQGDVIDIDILRTTVLEIGEWVGADQHTGRVVTIPNSFVLKRPLYNFTKSISFVWDEITVPITYESNWRRAEELILTAAQEYSDDLEERARAELEMMSQSYLVHYDSVEPAVYMNFHDNWIELTLRYFVDARTRRQVKDRLSRCILTDIEREPDIEIASATLSIVQFPWPTAEPHP